MDLLLFEKRIFGIWYASVIREHGDISLPSILARKQVCKAFSCTIRPYSNETLLSKACVASVFLPQTGQGN
ncbi:hypothetical protein TNCT_210532 [Trichonephila clavata]|uniref:Uncharacterized protein n=1 Tax=Trichonephila clavata TaxID=2740835 RepID=A0A8X6GEW8_TRICU|nr:hypothetical protein TNCT_210532 [Trichonephila clavata]